MRLVLRSKTAHEQEKAEIAPLFDEFYYISTYDDVRGSKFNALDHYIEYGWREGRDPSEWFSTRAYLNAYSDVRNAGVNPLLHYARWGKSEGRSANPGLEEIASGIDGELHVGVEETIRDEFDTEYYLNTYPDIGRNNLDPLKHYVGFGWREGRNPAAWFSTNAYLKAYPDVRNANINPFYHFIKSGRQDGRRIWPAVASKRDLVVDGKATFVHDHALSDWLKYPERPLEPASRDYDPGRLDIHWIIPDFSSGSGGHMTIFRMVRWLEFFGHRCTVWINNAHMHTNGVAAYDDVMKFFQTVRAGFRTLDQETIDELRGDVVIATGWETVWPATHATDFKSRIYFVQDYEPSFYPRGSRSLAAEDSYNRDIACVCASPWLEQRISDAHGRWTTSFHLAADNRIYVQPKSRPGPENRKFRIAFYSRVGTSRRAVELGFLAFEELARLGVDFHVDFFGQELEFALAPFSATDHGVLEPEKLAGLYGACDLGICFSTTNYSLIPQEMMQCGLPVLELDVESTRAVFPPDVITLAKPSPVALAQTIRSLIDDEARRREQASAALRWVRRFTWEKSARCLEEAILDRLAATDCRCLPDSAKADISRDARPKATVFIPTHNGGELFRRVMEKVRAQRTPWRFEICVIDTSSSDGTAEFCQSFGDIVFESIDPSEFGHGRTRNRGVELASGDFVAFLTQDAMPSDEFWLYDLVTSLERHPNGAGAFGRHIPWPDASPFLRNELVRMFDGFDSFPVALSENMDRSGMPAVSDDRWRQILHFYSDNNSCLRKSVWKQIPYPDVEYGEDQLWADSIIKAGYEKIYCRSAAVYHSHSYNVEETFERSKTEAAYFNEFFGYKFGYGNIEQQIRNQDEHDIAWGKAHQVDDETIAAQLALNKAKFAGYRAGMEAAKQKNPGSDLP